MAQLSAALGILLIALGLVSYFGTGRESVTALIPAFFGLPILIAGLVGLQESFRKHAMHLATLLALLGLIGALERPVRKLATGAELAWSAPLISQLTMAALCFGFVILAVKSFVDARRRRQ
ncbi:MAG: hypothetical protein GXY83_33375 [Rhodopirellula sp.]|nr:hypothetical protein [Rhodopirellula sp.]